jgi:hypothetical protein
VFEPPLRSRSLIGRRSVLQLLGVGALGLVAGCRSGKQRTAPTSPGPSTTPPTPSPQPAATPAPTTASASAEPTITALSTDQLVARRVAAAEQALLAAYDAVAVAHPELAGRLTPFRADHAAHLQGLVPGATPSTTTSATTAPSTTAPVSTAPVSSAPSSTASAGPPLSSPPASTAILHQLADLERSAAAARLGDVATTSGSLARLIASIGGCEAAHAALLSVAT